MVRETGRAERGRDRRTVRHACKSPGRHTGDEGKGGVEAAGHGHGQRRQILPRGNAGLEFRGQRHARVPSHVHGISRRGTGLKRRQEDSGVETVQGEDPSMRAS